MKRQQQKSQKELSAETKFTRQYFFVITSLPESICAEKVLEFYRLRWQVELVFKRLKSILGLGSLPVRTEEAAETGVPAFSGHDISR